MPKLLTMIASGALALTTLTTALPSALAACPDGDKKPSVCPDGDKKPSACPDGDKKPSLFCPDGDKKPSLR